jgi:4-hydroxybenzoate polyprenyltransferase
MLTEETSTDRSKHMPLCVDLDGTLVKTDVLFESIPAFFKAKLSQVWLMPIWLLRGKAYLKQQIFRQIMVDVRSLPYHYEFIEFLQREYRKGRKLVLVTATDMTIARQVASHLGIFSEVIASNGETNLSGCNKADSLTQRFGRQGYDYAGNSSIDLKVWAHANQAILVNAAKHLDNRVRKMAPVSHVFNNRPKFLPTLFKAMRVHQWTKNTLIFVPLIVSHHFTNPALILNAMLAFLAFSLGASCAYLLNDLIDLEADRHHPNKKSRPFASGDLSPMAGYVAIPCLFFGALAIGLRLPFAFLLILSAYFVFTTTYTFYFKQFVLIDVIVLAGLYALRIYAGGMAIAITPYEWLLAYSLFMFLSLALVKRFSELKPVIETRNEYDHGRGYSAGDLQYLATIGPISGYIAVLVLALYISSKDVSGLYSQPGFLWLICPMVFYWISRVWLLANRGQMHYDPVIFALLDKKSYVIAVATAIIMFLASTWGK